MGKIESLPRFLFGERRRRRDWYFFGEEEKEEEGDFREEQIAFTSIMAGLCF